MGGASGSEGVSAQLWRTFLNLDEPDGSLSYIFDQPSTRKVRAKVCAKRPRSRNWIPVERKKYLEATLEAVQGTAKGSEVWGFISRRLGEGSEGNFSRSAKECEYFWGTLRKAYRAIERHEKHLGGGPQTNDQYPRTVSYFEMEEESRSRNRFLPLPCYQLMHTILVEQEKRREKKEEKRQSSVDDAGPSHMVHSVVEEDLVTQLSSRHRLELSIAEQSKNAVDSCFESFRCRFSKVDLQNLSRNSLMPDIKEQVIAAVKSISYVRTLTSKEGRFDVDDPVAELAPFITKYIEDALKEVIAPVSSELEALEEIQERRQDIIEKRRALDREEKEIDESARRRHAICRFT